MHLHCASQFEGEGEGEGGSGSERADRSAACRTANRLGDAGNIAAGSVDGVVCL